MNHTEFFSMIKNGDVHGAYLFHGKEEYVKDRALFSVLQTVDEAAYDLNVQTMENAATDELIAACEVLPFFSDRRVVVFRSLPHAADAKSLLAYMENMPQTTLLILFIRGKADEKLDIVKWFKAKNRLVTFDPLDESEAVRYVLSTAKKMHRAITGASALRLVRLAGTDVGLLHNELCKAADYAGEGNEITPEAIEKAVTPGAEYCIFDMLDYFLLGRTADGLRALSSLIMGGQSPMSVAALIESRLKLMLTARKYIDRGLNRESVIKRVGGHYFAAQKAYEAAKRFTDGAISNALIEFANIPYLKISGTMNDTEALHLAILKHFGPMEKPNVPSL